jgi:hypothetical protein
MRVGPFELVDPTPAAVEMVRHAVASCDFPWELLEPALEARGREAVPVVWRAFADPNQNGAWEGQIVLRPGLTSGPFAEVTFLHEVGHMVDDYVLTSVQRAALLEALHTATQPGHDFVPHVETWGPQTSYMHSLSEAAADLFVAAFAPDVWAALFTPPRYFHWAADVQATRTLFVPQEASMPCRCAPALLQLRAEIDARYPGRDRASDGCCGDEAHRARRSDHNPLETGAGKGHACALDIDEDVVPGADLLWLVPILLADERTKYVIYEGQIFYPGQAPRAYTGLNAHKHHLHLSIHAWAVFSVEPWLPPQEDTMTPAQLETIKAAIKESEDRVLARVIEHTTNLRNTLAALERRIAAKQGITDV